MSTTGFVLKFVLPPGSGRIEGAGTGWRAAQKPVSLLWGGTRHDWGTVHLWLAVGFLAIVSLHVLFHWRWIACMIGKQPQDRSGSRLLAGLLALLVLSAFAIGPFISPVREVPRSELAAEIQDNLQDRQEAK
jgi:hypothetical protein